MALVSRYIFSDNVADSNNSFNGTATSITYASKPAGYNFSGKAAVFNGTSSKIIFGNHLGTNYTEYSISFWIKADATSESATLYQRSHTTDSAAVTVTRSVLNSSSDGAVVIDDFPPSGSSHSTDFGAVFNGYWYLVCYTRTGNTRRTYINGINVSTQTSAEVYSGVTPNFAVFGQDLRETNRNRWFKGSLGDFKIYNHCLSAEDILSQYKLESPTPISGGEILRLSSGEIVHNFFISKNFTTNLQKIDNLTYLLVGGGGGGGGSTGAGGGGGGFLTGSSNINSGNYSIVVGTGGAGGLNQRAGSNGANSTGLGLTAIGGGGGAATQGSNTAYHAGTGGSGGGGAKYGTASANFGNGTTGQGNRGGTAYTGGDIKMGGGGGAGQVGYPDGDGRGGNGLQSSISGTAIWYAGGGGAGFTGGGGGAGGLGGGGTGANNGGAGTTNTGGGGGGGWLYSDGTGGAGGSGIVILRYDPTQFTNNYSSSLLKLLPLRNI